MTDDLEKRDKSIEELINEADELVSKLTAYNKTNIGLGKLQNKLIAEKRFLQCLKDGTVPFKQSHTNSSNLKHLKAVLMCLAEVGIGNVSSVMQPFRFNDDASDCNKDRSTIDIVAFDGQVWIKVVARKPEALLTVWEGLGQFGVKNIVEVAQEFLKLSQQNPVDFQSSRIMFYFANIIPKQISDALKELKVIVAGPESDVEMLCKNEISKQNNFSEAVSVDSKPKVNLDITAMICLVSNICNGSSSYFYGVPVMDRQAVDERQKPVLPDLKKFIEGKRLIACQTAIDNFKAIVATVGGSNEKKRSEKLLQEIQIVPDNPSKRTLKLATSSKLNLRAKTLFGTGDHEEATTVTANIGFVRAAKQHGVNFSVFIHEARALTEIKEKYAKT